LKCPCPGCSGTLKVLHVYDVPGKGRTQDVRCPECLRHHTLVQFFAYPEPARGDGAYSVSRRWRAGRVDPKIEEHPDA